jgi:phosphoglycerol transferase MdoB-like AlkP superfamily enzyme
MSLETKLDQILDSAEMAYSEAVSGRENLPDYNANESSKDHMNNAESYLDDAIGDLQDLIKKLGDLS